jgi:hypothetical protein
MDHNFEFFTKPSMTLVTGCGPDSSLLLSDENIEAR